jgi:hypothetical protein
MAPVYAQKMTLDTSQNKPELKTKDDELWRSILKDDAYREFLKTRRRFRFTILILPLLTGLLAIFAGAWAARHGGDAWTAFTTLAITLPRIEYGVSQLAPHGDLQYGRDVLGAYTLLAVLAAFWIVFALVLGLRMHLRFCRAGSYRFDPYYKGIGKMTVLSAVAVAVLFYHMIWGLPIIRDLEDPSRFKLPANRYVLVFDSICLAGLTMFLLSLVVSLGYIHLHRRNSGEGKP